MLLCKTRPCQYEPYSKNKGCVNESKSLLRSLAVSFCAFRGRYKFFLSQKHELSQIKFLHYLSGEVQPIRKNIERMTKVIKDSE